MATIIQFTGKTKEQDQWYTLDGEVAFDETFLAALHEMVRRKMNIERPTATVLELQK